MKVIVADDNSEMRSLLKEALGMEGYEVVVVNDGLALLGVIKEHQDTEAVILDMMMPERDGSSVFQSIRSVLPATKIIIHTGINEYKNSVYGRQADAFIEKTEGVEKIIKILDELLN